MTLAHAQTASDNPLAPLAKTLQQRTDPPEPQDFVRRSRPGALDFVPVNTPRPQPGGKALTRDQIMAEEASLEAARARQDKLAARRPAAKAARSAAGDPYVAPEKKKQPAKCLLTCQIK
jgi:hypothetical protein